MQLNADFKMLTKVLAKRLAPVVEILIGDAQTCAIQDRSKDNFLSMQHLRDKVENKASMSRMLINLNQPLIRSTTITWLPFSQQLISAPFFMLESL